MRHHGNTERPDDSVANWDDMYKAVQHGLGVIRCESLESHFVENYKGQKQKALVISHSHHAEEPDHPQILQSMQVVITRAIEERPGMPEMQEVKSPSEMMRILMSGVVKIDKVECWRVTTNYQCPHCPELHSRSEYEEDVVEAATTAVSFAVQVLIRQALAEFNPVESSR